MMYSIIQKNFQKSYKERSPEYKERLMQWRKEEAIKRIDKPTNIARARSLGYRAVQGVFVVRVRIRKGRRKRRDPKAGRKARHNYRYLPPQLSLQAIAEQRANRKHPNAEVINSYWVGEDGVYKYFEVILADRGVKNKKVRQIIKRRGRAYRGLTSAGRKARGLVR